MRRKLGVIFATATIALAAIAGVGAHAAVAPTASQAIACKAGYYRNVSGHCVHRPVKAATAPAGATAKCLDGTYSFSEHASGTCSHHGGVARWINHP